MSILSSIYCGLWVYFLANHQNILLAKLQFSKHQNNIVAKLQSSNQNVAKKYMDIYTQYIFDELEKDNTFAKIIIINNGNIQCSNEKIRLDITEKAKNINVEKYFHHSNKIIFFASLIDYQILQKNIHWKNYEQLPFEHLPIYKQKNNLEEYLDLLFKNPTTIFETQRYNKKQQYWFDTKEKCSSVAKQWEQTNPEYANFKQYLFHAGDEQQLERFAYIYFRTMFSGKNNDDNENSSKLENNVWKDEHVAFPTQIYKTTFATIQQTMDYMMNKMKKGILVGIKNNQLVVFLPFSKANYQNTFWKELYFDEEDKRLLQKIDYLAKNKPHSVEQQEMAKKLQKKSEQNVYAFLKENKLPFGGIIADRKKWVANDCFFRYEDFEGDQNVLLFYDFLTELCKKRTLEDCIFVLNIRDHPVLDMFLRDSYSSIVDEPLAKKYVHQSYCPIFSVGCEKTKLDIPFITQDDWSQVSQKYYFDNCENGYVGNMSGGDAVPWEKKQEKAVFRGSATGCATGMDNIRIFASHLSQQYPDLIDAGITAKNRKIKKKLGEPLSVSNFKITEAKKMTLQEKATYKYILNLDGHVSAFRLGHEFSLGSLLLIPLSPYYLWFSFALKPFIHYIPVHPKLQDLAITIQWCKENDDYCKQIAKNGKEFYDTYLNENGVFDYMQYMISKISISNMAGLQFKQYPEHTIGIVSMFRDNANNPYQRLKQKRYFCYWMDKLMQNTGCKYEIVIVEQNYTNAFNIGKLKNIGYDVLKRTGTTFTNIIFADIDTIPDSVLFDYFFKPMDALCALAIRGTRYTNMTGQEGGIFVGALISATPHVFEQFNGFPNNFYGWQGEDENLILRLSETTKKVYIPAKGSILDMEENANFTQKHNKEKQDELNINKEKEKQVYEKNFDFMNYPENGLTNLQYKIEYQNKWKNGTHLIVDLLLEESMAKYPHHFHYSNFDAKADYKKWLKQKKKLVRQIEY